MNRSLVTFVMAAVILPITAARPQAPGSLRARLHALFDEAWQFELREDPLFATEVGDHRYNDRLPAVAREDEARRAQARRAFLPRLRAIDRSRLAPQDRVSYDILRRQLEDRIAEFEFGAYVLTLTADYGFHMGFADLPNRVPLLTTRDYDNYLARLRAFPVYVDQNAALMREGLERGFTVPRVTLEGYEATISPHVVDDPAKSVFWKPFETFPAGVPEEDRARLREAGRGAIAGGVVPAYRAF